MFKIGNIVIENQVIVAPMAGVTNLAFRSIMKEFNAGLVYTEMISDKGLLYDNQKTKEMLRVDPNEHPLTLQVFGGEVDSVVKAAQYIDEHSDCDIIDINMGCPVVKVAKSNAGAKLLEDPQLIYEMVKAVKAAIKKPLTVKIRAGWDKEHINAVEVAQLIEKAGADAIAIHPRTRSQLYEGHSDWSIIKDVKAAVKIPVIGNGDIHTPEDAKEMLETTGCDAVMIGRAVLGNPWLIKQTVDYLTTGSYQKEIPAEDKIAMCLSHAKRLVELKGEYTAVSEMRGQATWYLKGLPSSSQIKNQITSIQSIDELEDILVKYLNDLQKHEK